MTATTRRLVARARKYSAALLLCLAPLAAPHSGALPARAAPQFSFEVTTVDASTGKRRSSFALGEKVAAIFKLTYRGREPLRIKELEDTSIPVTLTERYNRSDRVNYKDGARGGTGGSYVGGDGTVFWTAREPRYTTIAPGQTVTARIDDLARFFSGHFEDGRYTLAAEYPGGPRSRCSFEVVIDEGVSVPILERLKNDVGISDRWAESYLRLIRQPAIGGRVAAPGGGGLPGVFIGVSGAEKTNIETRSGGRYELTHLTHGGTYTLTPSLEGHAFDPPSRTFKNLSSKLTGVNFKARRVGP